MSENTTIQWATHSWSPWLGCRKVSTCCENCYITETPALRFRGLKHGADRKRTSFSYWAQPIAWNRKAEKTGERPRIFPSLCDPFDSEVVIQWFSDFMAVVDNTPHLDWLLLTKRPQFVMPRWKQVCACNRRDSEDLPRNVWLGVSVGCQADADKWIPILLTIPAKIRFLSVEPLIEQVDLRLSSVGISWVIVGGESGRNARPCSVDWIRDVREQCEDVGVPCFVKQLGSKPIGNVMDVWASRINDKKGGEPSEWSEDLRVRQLPT